MGCEYLDKYGECAVACRASEVRCGESLTRPGRIVAWGLALGAAVVLFLGALA